MKPRFQFDFKDLSIEDQKYLFKFFEAEGCSDVEKFEETKDLEELLSLFDEDEIRKISRLSYLAALLAHEVVIYSTHIQYHMRKDRLFKSVYQDNYYSFDFELDWYDGLNNEHEGVISIAATIETYDLLDLKPIFSKYDFIQPS
jgi:hypothetical protein